MHALALLSLVASTALVAAQDEHASFQPLSTSFLGTLQARQQQQSCASVGGKTCGAKCIRLSYTCCGNGAGACEAGYTCGLAANGIYGCCPLGKRCRGDAPDPSTTDIGVARPTTVGAGAGDVDGGDGDETTATRAVESTTTRRPTPTSTPARTTAVVSDDVTISSSSTTSRSASTTRSSVVASGTSGSSVNGAGSDSNSNSNSNGNGNGNSNGSGSSSTTAGSGGNASQVSSAGNISVSLASLAGGFIAAIASLL
ncbi:hypothetical protein MY3296_005070 [Beauveria thailandica]